MEEEKGSGPKSKYAIDVMETEKQKIPQRKAAKDHVMPKFPFSMMISGRSGSGKTNLLMNIMTRDDLYGKYFHYIIVFSPTAGSTDDMYKKLKIPEENFIRELKPEFLTNLIEHRGQLIKEKGIEWVSKHARMCLIMDDVIAERHFLESPDALKMFTLLRHYLCSIIILMQSYNKLPRAARLSANAIAVFPASQSEVSVLLDEITPAGISKREFEEVIKYATDEPYNFLYINNHAPKGKNIRRNLDDIIDISKFKRKDIRKSRDKEDVTSDRGYVEEYGEGRDYPRFGGQAGKSRYPGDEKATQQATQSGGWR
jgi:hypothetical protein